METVSIGFTGTREGMNDKQKQTLWRIIGDLKTSGKAVIFHHGGCRGADLEAAEMLANIADKIWCYPGDLEQSRNAYTRGESVLRVKHYLERNKDIVTACDWLIAAPNGPEKTRSGTWSTVRYARAMLTPYVILER